MITTPKAMVLAFLACLMTGGAGCRRAETRTPTGPWVFVVLADNRGGNPYHRRLMQSAKADGAQLFLNLGDMVHPEEGCHWHDFLADVRAVYGDETPRVLENYFVTVGGWDEQYVNQQRRENDPPIKEADWTYAGKFYWPGYEPDNAAGQCFSETYFRYRQRAARGESGFLDYSVYGDYHVTYRNLHVLSVYLADEWHGRERVGPHDDPAARARAWEKQVEWLGARLSWIRRMDPAAPVVVMGHGADWLNQKGDSFRGRLCRLMAKYRVDLALCGDGHVYRFYPDPVTLKFMVPACLKPDRSGYFRITLDSRAMKLEHCNETGRVFDTFTKRFGEPAGVAAEP